MTNIQFKYDKFEFQKSKIYKRYGADGVTKEYKTL